MQLPEGEFKTIDQVFSVPYHYQVHFTHGVFKPANRVLVDSLKSENLPVKILVVIDNGVYHAHPDLDQQVQDYCHAHKQIIDLTGAPLIIPGGESCKNNPQYFQKIVELINDLALDRHSYIIAIGGGAVLDVVGYAAAIAHRGIRLVRLPTTVLAQNDSGVGVKNGINNFGKKNFIGTFTPPWAVINDHSFLSTLEPRDRRNGLAEAVKVGLIKDSDFFFWIKKHTSDLMNPEHDSLQSLIYRCAQLHLQHIASGDPFEQGSSRPLDFGHWSAHKLEQLSDYSIRHGEAVAMGMALDCVYSHLTRKLPEPQLLEILGLFRELSFTTYHSIMEQPELINGLDEFREHLGGKLTIMLLESIGKGIEVHEMETPVVLESIKWLKEANN